MKSMFSKTSQRVGVSLTCHTVHDLPNPVPNAVYVKLVRNNTELGDTKPAECNGKGNCCWDQTIDFEVTMYTDDNDRLKEKKLSIKIRDVKGDRTIAKGEVDLAPLMPRDGSVKKIKLELAAKKADKPVGLTVSIKPVWHDESIKHDDNCSEISDVGHFDNSDDDMDLNVTVCKSTVSRERSGSVATPSGRGHRRARSQNISKNDLQTTGSRGESITGGIPLGRARSESRVCVDEVEDLRMRLAAMEEKVKYAEEDARTSRELLEQRTKMWRSQDDKAESSFKTENERLRDENEALKYQVAALQASLEVACRDGTGAHNKASNEYTESLEMDLIHAKTEIATLKEGYDLRQAPQQQHESRGTPTSNRTTRPSHRRTHSRGDMKQYAQ